MFTSKRKLITVKHEPIDDPERVKDKILDEANRWLMEQYPEHKTALMNVELYSDEDASMGKFSTLNQTIYINELLVNAYKQTNNFNYVMETLKHELIHFVLYERFASARTKDLSFTDGYPPFEDELKKHGMLSNYENLYGVGYRLAIYKHLFTNKYDIKLITNRLKTTNIRNLKEMKFNTNATLYNSR